MAKSGPAELEPVGSAGRMQKVGSDDPTAAVLRPAAKGESTSDRRRWPEPYRSNVSGRRRQRAGGRPALICLVSSHSRWLGARIYPARLIRRGRCGAGCLRERCRVVKAGKIRRRPSHRNESRCGCSAASALRSPRRRGEERSVRLERSVAAGHGWPTTAPDRADRSAWPIHQYSWNEVAVRSGCGELIRSTRRPGCIDVEGNEPTPLLVVHPYRR